MWKLEVKFLEKRNLLKLKVNYQKKKNLNSLLTIKEIKSVV